MSTLTKNKKPNAFVRLTKHSEFTIGLVVIALFLLATFLTKNFFGSYNLKNLTKQGAIVGVLAVAQTFIIITSGIDISGGAIAGLGCMTMAMIMNGKGTSMLGIAILANFVVCTLCGFLNGVIIFDLKVPAMIATLGTQTIFRGILKLLCNGNSISFFEPDGATFVKLFDTIGNYDIFGVLPVLACIWIVVAVIAFLVLRYTVFGRDLFVIGSGIEVARLSGSHGYRPDRRSLPDTRPRRRAYRAFLPVPRPGATRARASGREVRTELFSQGYLHLFQYSGGWTAPFRARKKSVSYFQEKCKKMLQIC